MARQKFSHKWYVAALTLAAIVLAVPASAKTELWVFSSPYCGPCQQLKPTLAAMESEGYPIRHVDIMEHPALASRHRVDRVPCLIMVQDGQEAARQLGGDRNSIQRMFAAAGVRPGQRQPTKPMGWDGGAQAAPSLPNRPLEETGLAGPPNEVPPGQGIAKKLLESSVRITVEDSTGKSYGTGTIVDTLKEDALIVTCGHLFRCDTTQQQSSNEKFEAQIVVEQFTVTPAGLEVKDRSVGQLLYCDLDRDVALVAFRPTQPAKVAPVAASFVEKTNDRVYSVGCDRGADPTVRDSRVTAVNRYNGAPNVETSGAPVQGRSGGGLFNSRGELIGVCFAADNEGDEGLYSGLASVHVGLDALGLQNVYSRPSSSRGVAQTGALTPLPDTSSNRLEARGQTPSENDRSMTVFPPQPADTPPAAGAPAAQPSELSGRERAALQEIARRAVDSEVTVIVRPRDPNGKSVILQLDRVSPQFVEELGNVMR